MALSPMYAAILQDLNRAVAISQPEDVLQFCANWFNAKLEEQRIAGRASIAQAEANIAAAAAAAGAAGHMYSPTGTSTRSKSISGPSASGPLKKKPSLPSLVGQGYSFGSSGKVLSPTPGAPPHHRDMHSTLPDRESDSAGPSPFSEVPPNLRIPPMPNLRTSSSNPSLNGHAAGGIPWARSFGTGPAGSSGDLRDSDEENLHSDLHQSSGSRSGSESRDRLGALPVGVNNRDNGIPSGYNLGRRTSVSAESIDPNSLSSSSHALPKTIIPKTPSQKSRIEASIEKNLLFRNLDEDQHTDVLNAMKEVRVTKGTEVIVQGAVGDFFYVVEQGEFQVWVKPQNSSGMILSPTPSALPASARARSLSPGAANDPEAQDDGTVVGEDGSVIRADGSKLVATISAGGSFGELALMYNAPRAATVICSSANATLWALDRVTFRTILMEHTFKKRKLYEKFLSEVPILLSLENYERSKIADALEERIYEEGEDVVREGELGKNFYIIESGRAEVLKKKGDKIERVGTLSKGDYFGELALLNSAPRAATVRPLPGSGRLRVATLGEKAFTRLLGPVVEILTRRAERNYGTAVTGASSPPPSGASSSSRRDRAHDRDSEGGDRDRERERESTVPIGTGKRMSSRTSTPSRRSREEKDREDIEMTD